MKSALVVFPDEWVSYSPTVLNLISCLENEGYIDNNNDNHGKQSDQTHDIFYRKQQKEDTRLY